MRCLFCVLLIFSGAFLKAKGQPIINLDEKEEVVFPSESYKAMIDFSGKLTLEDILRPQFQQKFVMKEKLPNSERELFYWIKLEIKNPEIDKRWLLEVQSLHTPEVDFYIPSGNDKYTLRKAGHSRYFTTKEDYKVKNIVFELPFNQKGINTYYIRIKSYSVTGFYFKIHTSKSFVEYTSNEYILLGMYYGILLIIALYNFILFITNKETVFILYVVYVLSCIMSSLTEDGLGFQYLWPEIPSLNIFINYYAAPLLFLLSFIIYSRKFLELRVLFKKQDNILLIVLGVYVILYIYSLYLPGTSLTHIIYFIPFATIFLIGIYAYGKGYKPARFYVLGYSIICLSVFVNMLRGFSLLSPSYYTVYSFNIGLIIEACVMSFALGDKFKIVKEQKEKAQKSVIEELRKNKILQEKVNKELEEKVQERTVQLKEANIELLRLSDELQVMNSKLDLDNWKLKRKIDQEKQTSIVTKVVSFEEFKKGFPNENSCQRYIESLKWKDDYFVCRKCDNEKYLLLSKSLSRKCSKCNYIESVTAYTLYHGVRFPLVKAFYITHLVMNDIKDVHISDMMETLELAKNTCWKFRKKVDERLKEVKKDKKKISSWKDLIIA